MLTSPNSSSDSSCKLRGSAMFSELMYFQQHPMIQVAVRRPPTLAQIRVVSNPFLCTNLGHAHRILAASDDSSDSDSDSDNESEKTAVQTSTKMVKIAKTARKSSKPSSSTSTSSSSDSSSDSDSDSDTEEFKAVIAKKVEKADPPTSSSSSSSDSDSDSDATSVPKAVIVEGKSAATSTSDGTR